MIKFFRTKEWLVALSLLGVLSLGLPGWTQVMPPDTTQGTASLEDADKELRSAIIWMWGLPGLSLSAFQRTPEWNQYAFDNKSDKARTLSHIKNGLNARRWKVTEKTSNGVSSIVCSKDKLNLEVFSMKDASGRERLVVEIGRKL